MDRAAAYREAVLALLRCKTEAEVLIARKHLRPLCDPLQLTKWGYRTPRKERAESIILNPPSDADLEEAEEMLDAGWLAHNIEQYFAAMDVRVSRNKLSRLCGARP
jgi:hypothetical protein